MGHVRAIKHGPKSITFPVSEDVPSAIKNVSTTQGMSGQWFEECRVSKNNTSSGCHVDGVGEALVFPLKTSHQLKTGGACVPSRPWALTKVKVNVGAKVNMW